VKKQVDEEGRRSWIEGLRTKKENAAKWLMMGSDGDEEKHGVTAD